MIYQLARTSPLLSGQVKLNMILNGTTVDNLYYVPLSKHIPFNYSLPNDTLNYTHGENVRMLYNKTKGTFFKDIHDPKLSETALYRSPGDYICDTHDGSYEMSLRRLEYNRYKKQFEFFCPVWCDNKEEFKNIVFYLTIANNAGKRLFRKRIDTSKVNDYFAKFYDIASETDDNKDLAYINFKNCEAHIKGLNVESGNIQVVDTSYIISTLTSCERTVMETDSILASMFSSNKIISTQLYNFAFCFNLEDVAPLYFINDISGDFINAFVDVFVNKGTSTKEDLVQCEIKDLYTNYDFIPKYDIFKSSYTEDNVLDYMQDYNSIDLATKNKITQGIFHWSLKSNKNEIFNLYNGFSPVNNGNDSCNGISNGITDMYTDTFDLNKNPFGLFNFKNIQNIGILQNAQFLKQIENNDNYVSVDLKLNNIKKNETQLFGNVIINNVELYKKIQLYHENIQTIKAHKINFEYDDYTKTFADYTIMPIDTNNNIIIEDNTEIYFALSYADIEKLYASVFLINENFNIDTVKSFLSDWIVVPMELLIEHSWKQRKRSNKSFIAIYYKKDDKSLNIAFLTNDINDIFIHSLFFRSLYSYDPVAYDARIHCANNSFITYNEKISEKNQDNKKYIINRNKKTISMNNNDIVYNSYALLCDVIKCINISSVVTLNKSLTSNISNAPNIASKEINYKYIITNIVLQRYDGNILPTFVELNSIFYNNTYWNKQYQKTIYNHIMKFGNNDEITKFVNISNTKFLPFYRSCGYYCINSTKTDYNNFYLDLYDGEKSWYKKNFIIALPISFTGEIIKTTGENITEDDIFECVLRQFENHKFTNAQIKHWIYDLYQYKYTYDYISDTDITKQKYKITFNLK